MSRLDSFIRRLEAQRACLDYAAALAAKVPGPVLELGLGNGRTYDHLRTLCPEREIFAFDRQVAAHPACVPDPAHLLLGDFRQTLDEARRRLPAPAAIVHADTGSGDAIATTALAEMLGPRLAPVLALGAIIVSDQALAVPGAEPLALPEGVASGRYFIYRFRR